MKLLIRTEASSTIGMGHFMRCFAIAESACERGWHVTFLLNEVSQALAARVASIGAEIQTIGVPLGRDAPEIMATEGDWLLIDSYAMTEAYLTHLSQRFRVAVIDDLASLERFDCDLVINPAQSAADMDYGRLAPKARHLLGAEYALIRSEFRRDYPSATTPFIAVMFGGSDPVNLTGECVQRIRSALPDISIRLIAGPANQQIDALRTMVEADPQLSLYVDPPSVAAVLAHAEMVVTAAGGTLGEVAAMRLPALALVVYDNQAAALKACPFPVIDARTGLPPDLGQRVRDLLVNKVALRGIAAKAQALVDGRGAERILAAMEARDV